jgi:hypothetical protein
MGSKMRMIRRLLPIFLTSLILFEIVAYTTTVPAPSEKFFQMYVLGFTGNAGNYYPHNSSSLQIGENVQWNLAVVNDMGLFQYVSIQVKLGSNQTTDSPNDTLARPSPAPLITEFKHFILDNETWNVPFYWQIVNYTTTTEGRVSIHSLTIDNVTLVLANSPVCPAINSCSFRLIFELWTWNVDSDNFQFGWVNGDQQRTAWLQIWFNLAPGGQHR